MGETDVKDYCDKCGQIKSIKRLDTGGGSGAWLCSKCHTDEMRFRKQRNKTLGNFAKFTIGKW